jgi:hypothetical protein
MEQGVGALVGTTERVRREHPQNPRAWCQHFALRPRNGDYAALVTFFRDYDVPSKAITCHRGRLRCGSAQWRRSVVVTAMWDSAAAYDGWRTHPIRDGMSPFIEQVVDTGVEDLATSGGVYDIVLSASRSTAAA